MTAAVAAPAAAAAAEAAEAEAAPRDPQGPMFNAAMHELQAWLRARGIPTGTGYPVASAAPRAPGGSGERTTCSASFGASPLGAQGRPLFRSGMPRSAGHSAQWPRDLDRTSRGEGGIRQEIGRGERFSR